MFSKLSTTVLVALIGLSGLHGVEAFTCSAGLYSEPKCCAALFLGVLGIDCTAYVPALGECPVIGKTNHCCAVPVANQALLCQFAGQ